MKQTILKLFLILSPFFVSYGAALINNYIFNDPDGGSLAVGIGIWMSIIFGIPFVAICGLIFSFIVRNKANSEKLSIFGYFVPALLTWLYGIMIFL